MNNTTADTPLFLFQRMEGEVISSFLPDLVTAVSDSVLSVSDQCLAKGLINETVYKRVLESGWTSEDKARTLILAVKKSTETDSRCLEILLNILDQELPFAIRENLLSKIRKELTEKANTCRAVVPLSKAVQQVPLGELSKETTLQQSALLGRFEDSIRQHEHACAKKRLLEKRLKVKSEKCERLKGELETLKGQNEELGSSTQSRIAAYTNQIETLMKRIEELQKTIEEQGMQARRGRNTIITKTEKMFIQLAQQSQQEVQRREKEAEEQMKERNHKMVVQEKELRIRQLEFELEQQKKSLHFTGPIPSDVIKDDYVQYIFDSIVNYGYTVNGPISRWRDIGSYMGFTKDELDHISKRTEESLKKRNCFTDDKLKYDSFFNMLCDWFNWYPGDKKGRSTFTTYSDLQRVLMEAGFGDVARDLISYEELVAKVKEDRKKIEDEFNLHGEA